MSHTTGPWCVIGSHVYQVEEVGGRGVLHGGSVKGATTEEREANIRLIARAPELEKQCDELLEACRKLLDYVELVTFSLGSAAPALDRAKEAQDAGRVAITNARGESNASN